MVPRTSLICYNKVPLYFVKQLRTKVNAHKTSKSSDIVIKRIFTPLYSFTFVYIFTLKMKVSIQTISKSFTSAFIKLYNFFIWPQLYINISFLCYWVHNLLIKQEKWCMIIAITEHWLKKTINYYLKSF